MLEILRQTGPTCSSVISEDIVKQNTVADTKIIELGGGIIRFPFAVPTAKSFILKEECPKKQSETFSIFVPPLPFLEQDNGMLILDPILNRADNIIRNLNNWKADETTTTKENIVKSVIRYYTSIKEHMCGKKGLLSKLFSARCDNSLRGVIVPNMDMDWDQVGIPEKLMIHSDIKEDDWVLLFRHPVVHEGSCLFLRAHTIKGIDTSKNAIYLQSIYMESLDADFDGDTVSIIKVPDPMQHKVPQYVTHQKTHCVFPTEVCIETAEGPIDQTVDWLEFYKRQKELQHITGRSIGPEDLLTAGGYFDHIAKVLPKKFDAEEIKLYGRGIKPHRLKIEDEPSFEEVAEDLVKATAATKMMVGKIGATTDRLIDCHTTERQLLAATFIKRHLTEASMDFKHVNDYQDHINKMQIILDLINGKIPIDSETNKFIPFEDYLKRFPDHLEPMVSEIIEPIVKRLYDFGEGSQRLFEENCPIFSNTKDNASGRTLYLLYDTIDKTGIGTSVNFQRNQVIIESETEEFHQISDMSSLLKQGASK